MATAQSNLAIVLGVQGQNAVEKAFGGITGAAKGMIDGLGKIGLAGMGFSALIDGAKGLGDALGLGLNAEMENTRAKLNAFTKDAALTDKIMADLRKEAAATPFAFKDMSNAAAALLPASKQAGVGLMDLIKQAEILAALNPEEGLAGAAFSLREALSGDFVSIVERFNLPKQRLNELKAEGVPALEAITIAMKEMGVDASLVSAMANTATGRWSTFMDTIDTLRAEMSAPLFEGLSAGLGELQGVLDSNMPAMQEFARTIGEGLGVALATVIGLIKEWAPGLQQAFSFFATGSGDIEKFRGLLNAAFGPQVTQGIIEVFTNLTGLWQEQLIPALKSLGEIAKQVFSGDIQGAIKALGAHVERFAPMLAASLADWSRRFIEWVAPIIPPLLAEMGRLFGLLLSWLGEQAIIIGGKLINEWAPAFIAWIGPMIPPFLAKMGELAAALLAWLGARALELGVKLVTEWVPAFLAWVAPLLAQLPGKLAELLGALLGWLTGTALPAVGEGAAVVGRSIVDGIIAGAQQIAAKLQQAIAGLAQQALDAAKRQLGIRSPSREAADEIGAPLVEGIIAGIGGKAAALGEALGETVGGATSELTAETRTLVETFVGELAPVLDQMTMVWLPALGEGFDDVRRDINKATAALQRFKEESKGVRGGGGGGDDSIGGGDRKAGFAPETGYPGGINAQITINAADSAAAGREVGPSLARLQRRQVVSGAL